MENNRSMNRLYRVIWNGATGTWQAVTEVAKGKGKSNKRLRPSLIAGAFVLMSAAAYADALPTGGTVVGGNATISQSGNNMTINQTSTKMAANWQSFSIGAGNTVTFKQPSASSVALNRVVGADVSLIQGALKANGQVFLINPNGILFTPTARVDVGGIVASTLSLSTVDFMAGNYKFAGSSSNAIVNQGDITTVNGATIALIAAKITNSGNLNAKGGNVLLGAGSLVTLDLGGPVKLKVEQGAIDALIENGGAIKADGGLVYLTAKAAGELTSTVINNTGVIEAQTLASGEKGAIYLMGGMDKDRIVVGGKLDASATNGGDGGFIETSAANVQTLSDLSVSAASAHGKGGEWLIDPTNITIRSKDCIGSNCLSAEVISKTLNNGTDVSIITSAVDTGTELGNIFVRNTISWEAAATLTLTAHNNIYIYEEITATNKDSIINLQYGLNSENGGTSTAYYQNNANAATVTNQKGSQGAVATKYFTVFVEDAGGNLSQGDLSDPWGTGDLSDPWSTLPMIRELEFINYYNNYEYSSLLEQMYFPYIARNYIPRIPTYKVEIAAPVAVFTPLTTASTLTATGGMVSGGLNFLLTPTSQSANVSTEPSTTLPIGNSTQAGMNASGFMSVEVTDGGIRLAEAGLR